MLEVFTRMSATKTLLSSWNPQERSDASEGFLSDPFDFPQVAKTRVLEL